MNVSSLSARRRKAHGKKPQGGSRRPLWPKLAPFEWLEDRLMLSAVAWDGGGNGTTWLDPRNWDADRLPGSGDDVTINVATNPTIRLDAGDVTVKSLQTSEALVLSGNSFTTTGVLQVNAQSLTLAAGTLSSGSLGVSGATFNFNGGSIVGAVTLIDSALNVSSAGAGSFTFYGTTSNTLSEWWPRPRRSGY